MRALSVKQPWAELIAAGKKKIEYRTWSVDLRGELLIVASKSRNDDEVRARRLDPGVLLYGKAVCVVDLVKVTGEPGDYEWHLKNPRRVAPVDVTGYASLYTVPDERIRFVKAKGTAAKAAAAGAKKKTVKKKQKAASR